MNNLLLNILKAIVPGYADLLKDKEHSSRRIETLEKELEKIRNLQKQLNDSAEVPKAKTVEVIPEFFKKSDKAATKKIPQPYSNIPPSAARAQAQSSPVEQLMPGTLASVLVADAVNNTDQHKSDHLSSSISTSSSNHHYDTSSRCSSNDSSSSPSHSSSSHSSYDSSSSCSSSSSSSSWD